MKACANLHAVPNQQYLTKVIRNALSPDSPELLYDYLTTNQQLGNLYSTEKSWQIHVECYQLLLNVVCDPMLPTHWRSLCLDNLHKPLGSLKSLTAGNKKLIHFVEQLHYELTVLSNKLY